jgi:hypothetical protein
MSYRVGIDTGGTFTDVIAVDDKGNRIMAKSPTTPQDLKTGIMNCLDQIAQLLRDAAVDVASLIFLIDVRDLSFDFTVLVRLCLPHGIVIIRGTGPGRISPAAVIFCAYALVPRSLAPSVAAFLFQNQSMQCF